MSQLGHWFRAVLIAGVASIVVPVSGTPQTAEELTAMSLESLMNVRVTSVARREERLQNAAAAVYVITEEDIRRSGATDVADVLRGVPGLHVAQMNANVWAISARGFASQYATKMLVLVDGRSVYDPSFSGVYWHLQNLVLGDIERIEVIRGPGATMWGSNAVNGVVSITTKAATDTEGGNLTVDSGSGRPAEGTLRYGGSIGDGASYRVFARQTTRSSLSTDTGQDAGDAWRMASAGFRLDWDLSTKDSLTVDADAYSGHQESRQLYLASLTPPSRERVGRQGNHGGHARARFRHRGEDSALYFQFYLDRREHTGFAAKNFQVLDFESQYDVELGGRHHVTLGGGHRSIHDLYQNSVAFGFAEPHLDSSLSSAFVQDEMTLVADTLFLTAGAKLERSSFTGYNVQPTVRVSYRPAFRHTLWGSAARAVRTANRVERGMYINVAAFEAGPNLGVVTLYGREETRSEELTAFEAGYRYRSNRRFWSDVALFYNLYDHLRTVEAGEPYFQVQPSPPRLVTPLYLGNQMGGATYGAEVAVNYEVNDSWTLRGSYGFLEMQLEGYPGSSDVESAETEEGRAPRHQAYVGSFVRLPGSFELAGHAYAVSRLSALEVPAYARLDLNLTWSGPGGVALSLVGQNLFGAHAEYADHAGTPTSMMARRLFGRIAWSF